MATPVGIEQAILAAANAQAAAIATAAGLPAGTVLTFVQTGEDAGTGLVNPRVGLVCDILVSDPNPNIPGT